MRFIIKQAGSGSERIGCLTEFVKLPTASIDTPTSALFTQVFTVYLYKTDDNDSIY